MVSAFRWMEKAVARFPSIAKRNGPTCPDRWAKLVASYSQKLKAIITTKGTLTKCWGILLRELNYNVKYSSVAFVPSWLFQFLVCEWKPVAHAGPGPLWPSQSQWAWQSLCSTTSAVKKQNHEQRVEAHIRLNTELSKTTFYLQINTQTLVARFSHDNL